MAPNVGLDASFNNIYDWKGIREKAEEINSMKPDAQKQIMRFPVQFSTGVTLI
jgi:hypothetical protein